MAAAARFTPLLCRRGSSGLKAMMRPTGSLLPIRSTEPLFTSSFGPTGGGCRGLSHHYSEHDANSPVYRRPIVGSPAPYFEGEAFMPSGKIEKICLKELLSRYDGVCLIFYPLNFTFVCPTELHAFNKKFGEFEKRNWALLGVSVDSAYSHGAWTRLPPSEGGVGPLSYPLLSDLSKKISRDYGLLFNDSLALRGAVLIGKDGYVRHLTINDLSMGRNVDETLRVIDMIDYVRLNGAQVCPANWAKGKKALEPTVEAVKDYLGRNPGA